MICLKNENDEISRIVDRRLAWEDTRKTNVSREEDEDMGV